MGRKVLAIATAATIMLGMSIAPSNAATIKSGVACTKLNAKVTIKFSGDSYVYNCVKNPLYKKTKLTWTLKECLDAIKDYNNSLKAVNATKAAGGTPTSTDTQLLGMAKDLRDMSCQAGV